LIATVVLAHVDGQQPDVGPVLLHHSGASAGDFIFG